MKKQATDPCSGCPHEHDLIGCIKETDDKCNLIKKETEDERSRK